MAKLFLTTILLFTILISNAQNILGGYEHLFSTPRNYVVYQAISEIVIDGRADEISWQKAEWTDYFEDIEGDKKPAPTYKTRVKMLWDKQNLYIFAELEEPHIWAYYLTRDQIVYHENDFEIFIDPDGDTHNYFEFELNAQNTLLDLFMPKPYRNGGNYDIGWDADGFKSAVFIDGTVNNPADTDKKWTVEVAIPFSSLTMNVAYYLPKDGDTWKINFSRVQWQTEIVDGKYQKVKDPNTGRFLPEDNWVWSQQGVINMHFPERWGIANFSTNPVGQDKINFVYPEEEILGKYLWLLYYKQQNYRSENGSYAVELSEIGLQNKIVTESGEDAILTLETYKNGFKAFLDNTKGLILSINHNGFFQSNLNDSDYE
jgi:hypothetical protein